jgi:hypothetical protein
MTERECDVCNGIIREMERRDRRRHWRKVAVWVGLFLAGAVCLLAVGTLLSQVIHLAVAR